MGSFIFLGTGASAGVPVIGCKCPVCLSQDPHNKRLRPSILLTLGSKRLLIDTGPDFRTQALRQGVEALEGVILTHSHFDHVAGLDELRALYFKTRQPLPVLVSASTYEDLKIRYYYLFERPPTGYSFTAQLDFQILPGERGEGEFQGVPFTYVTYEQGGMKVNGFRWGDFAYISDIRLYSESVIEDLKGVKIVVVSALRQEPTLLQFSVGEAIEFSKKIGATQTYLTHISHELDHEETARSLPAGVMLGYDGLQVGLP